MLQIITVFSPSALSLYTRTVGASFHFRMLSQRRELHFIRCSDTGIDQPSIFFAIVRLHSVGASVPLSVWYGRRDFSTARWRLSLPNGSRRVIACSPSISDTTGSYIEIPAERTCHSSCPFIRRFRPSARSARSLPLDGVHVDRSIHLSTTAANDAFVPASFIRSFTVLRSCRISFFFVRHAARRASVRSERYIPGGMPSII